MPRYTEQRIRDLCAEALANTNDADGQRVIDELRTALQEHIQLAKESLACQVTAINWRRLENTKDRSA